MQDQGRYHLAGVMGWPVLHSRSPAIHRHWFEELGMHGDYVLLQVPPQQLHAALRGLPALGFSGCNLTIPHKVAALDMVDHLTDAARRIGAVNTIIVGQDGSLTGHNTDAQGYTDSVSHACTGWKPEDAPAVVMGAGGAARAVISGLLARGCPEIRVANRNPTRAQDMAARFGPAITALSWQERHAALSGAGLLVNTTNQGMAGQPALDLNLDALPVDALVSDIVYVPRETPLLLAARQRGNPTVDGLGMLIHQARLAFEAWFGVLPVLTPGLVVDAAKTR